MKKSGNFGQESEDRGGAGEGLGPGLCEGGTHNPGSAKAYQKKEKTVGGEMQT